MKSIRFFMIILLLAALCFTAGCAENTAVPENCRAGDIVTFGSYEQDNNQGNGAEPIEWIVLETRDGKALLLSRYALDEKVYRNGEEANTWEDCSLRKWLNGEFLDAAFTGDEQARILLTKVENGAGQSIENRQTEGNDTKDRIFLLSFLEAERYFSGDEARMCVPTEFTIANGAFPDGSYQSEGRDTWWWWLRSPQIVKNSDRFVGMVGPDGAIWNGGYNGHNGVRPALWLSLKATGTDAQDTADTGSASDSSQQPETWTCPECGKENSTAFCRWCGTKKPEAAERYFCPACGAEYDPDGGYLFCGDCGARLPERSEQTDDPAAALAGTWTLKDASGSNQDIVYSVRMQIAAGYFLQYTFNTDGSLKIYARFEYQDKTVKGAYTADGNRLTVSEEDGTEIETTEYSVSGDTLEMNFGDYSLIFTRSK